MKTRVVKCWDEKSRRFLFWVESFEVRQGIEGGPLWLPPGEVWDDDDPYDTQADAEIAAAHYRESRVLPRYTVVSTQE